MKGGGRSLQYTLAVPYERCTGARQALALLSTGQFAVEKRLATLSLEIPAGNSFEFGKQPRGFLVII